MTADQIDIAVINSLVLQLICLSVFCGYIFGVATAGFVSYWVDVSMRFIRRAVFRSKQVRS